jgi:A/G-specific adenine glycosylase
VIDAGAVLAWGASTLRDLPWRHERDPWVVLVAEVMLQQTQADRVIPKWQAFLAAYPDPAACAAASLADVLRLWQGLGYPRRARNLHQTAALVVERHGGELPDDLGALLALPGVGAYTARAVLAFAFERDVGVVDTNIARVLARSAGERLTPRRAQEVADAVVPDGHGWIWNQVLMDLGATVCRPVPRCGDCPIGDVCRWSRAGFPDPDPAVGSAGVSRRQAPFDGSDRQARGRVLAALQSGPRRLDDFDDRIVATLVADGLVAITDTTIHLPH